MKFELKLEPLASIKQKASGAVASALVQNLNTRQIENRVRDLLVESFEQQREWRNLLSGDPKGLAADFGIPIGSEEARLDKFLQIWLNSVKITTQLRLFGSSFRFRIILNAIKADYSDVLGTQEALVYNATGTENAQTLPWLEWLLTFGNKTIIKDHRVRYLRAVKGSRSQKAIMQLGGSFSVNPVFAGTRNDNFVTDTVLRVFETNEFSEIFEQALVRALQ